MHACMHPSIQLPTHNLFKVHYLPELSSGPGPKEVLNERVIKIQKEFKLEKVLWKTQI